MTRQWWVVFAFVFVFFFIDDNAKIFGKFEMKSDDSGFESESSSKSFDKYQKDDADGPGWLTGTVFIDDNDDNGEDDDNDEDDDHNDKIIPGNLDDNDDNVQSWLGWQRWQWWQNKTWLTDWERREANSWLLKIFRLHPEIQICIFMCDMYINIYVWYVYTIYI